MVLLVMNWPLTILLAINLVVCFGSEVRNVLLEGANTLMTCWQYIHTILVIYWPMKGVIYPVTDTDTDPVTQCNRQAMEQKHRHWYG